MATSATYTAAGCAGHQKVEGLLSCQHARFHAPSNCPVRIVASVRGKNTLRTTNLRSLSTWTSLGLPSGSQKPSDWRLPPNVAGRPGPGFQRWGFMAQSLLSSESSLSTARGKSGWTKAETKETDLVDVQVDVSVPNMDTVNASALNNSKPPAEMSPFEVSLTGASATHAGENVSNPITKTGTETSTSWRGALATALKTKCKAVDGRYQPGFSTGAVFDQLELEPADPDANASEAEGLSEVLHVVKNLEKKHILITGVTGFLAKVLVEKILRTQPGVGQLYLLIRERGVTVEERIANAVFGTSLFKPLREEYGDEKFVDFIVSKVTPVSGDIAKPGLNLRSAYAHVLRQKLDVIISSAATTKFDERYDIAIEVNTLGPLHLLNFAKQCPGLSLYQHVSTAYVNGKRKGVSLEIPFEYSQNLVKEIGQDRPSQQERTVYPQLDPEAEARLALKMWEDLNRTYPPDRNGNPHPHALKDIVKLGKERAEMFGWHDTYTLTKAMGEQMIMKHKGDVAVAIIRPSVVESTVRLPFDGWIEGQRMLDPIAVAYGKGQLRAFLVDPDTVLDVIPADIVVNVMLAAMAKHRGSKQVNPFVYQVASSASNPLTMRKIADVSFDHFKKYPMVSRRNSKKSLQPIEEIQVNYLLFLKSELVFRFFVYLFLELPLQILTSPYLENDKRISKLRISLKFQLETVNNLANTYKPYVFYEGRFDATNSEKLLTQVSSEEQHLFGYSVKDLDWYMYLNKSHLPGLRQHVLNWKQTGRIDPTWTIIDPLPERDVLPQQQTLRSPSRGGFQVSVWRKRPRETPMT